MAEWLKVWLHCSGCCRLQCSPLRLLLTRKWTIKLSFLKSILAPSYMTPLLCASLVDRLPASPAHSVHPFC